jgi:hypothetical protein
MDYKLICLALILLVIGTITGCEKKYKSSQSGSSKAAPKSAEIAPNGFPADWTTTSELSLSTAKSPEGLLEVTLTGRNQSFNGIVEKIRGNVPKPINFGAKVDTEQVLPEFEIKMAEGSWTELLTLIAAKFNCIVEESNTEFLVVPGKKVAS